MGLLWAVCPAAAVRGTRFSGKRLLGITILLLLTLFGQAALFAAPKPKNPGPQPDLIVRSDVLEKQWVVRDEHVMADWCSAIEGGIQQGVFKVLRFTVTTPNIGAADLAIGDPNERPDLFENAECHGHFHFKDYARYELVDPRTGKVWKAAKRGFCMLDSDPYPAYEGDAPPRQFKECGALGKAGNQGISRGWSDTYRLTLGGQYFVLDGGDGQPPVPPGTYKIQITVNPNRVFTESNYGNNVGEATVTVPDKPGRTGVGPLAGTPHPTSEPAEH